MGLGALSLSGGNSDSVTTPDVAYLDIVGDIDLRIDLAMNDWTPGSIRSFGPNKWTSATANRSWSFGLTAANLLYFRWWDGAGVDSTDKTVANPGFADGTRGQLRVTLDVDNGDSNYDLKFWKRTDGRLWDHEGWTQHGSTIQGLAVTTIRAESGIPTIGAAFGGDTTVIAGTLYRAMILSGIGPAGTVVLDADFTALTAAQIAAKTFSEKSSKAAVMTINGTGFSAVPDSMGATAIINANSIASHTIVPAIPDRRIRVTSMFLTTGGTVNLTWQKGLTPTAISGPMGFVANGRMVGPVPNLVTGKGEALKLALSTAVQVSGHLTYVVE